MLKEKAINVVKNFRNGLLMGTTAGMMMSTAIVGHCADFGTVEVKGEGANASQMMGRVIGILLTITRYVGVALVIYGIYEVIMSFMQNQPEAKTKGIIMALAGVVMIALKSVLQGLQVIG